MLKSPITITFYPGALGNTSGGIPIVTGNDTLAEGSPFGLGQQQSIQTQPFLRGAQVKNHVRGNKACDLTLRVESTVHNPLTSITAACAHAAAISGATGWVHIGIPYANGTANETQYSIDQAAFPEWRAELEGTHKLIKTCTLRGGAIAEYP